MFDKGFFGNLFDLNGDGKLDGFEKAADFATFVSLIENTEKAADKDSNNSDDTDDD